VCGNLLIEKQVHVHSTVFFFLVGLLANLAV